MSGRKLAIGFLIFLAVFVAALIWFQFFAFYFRTDRFDRLAVNGAPVAVVDYRGIDATSSPLKLRGCFEADPSAFADAAPAPDATPLTAPFWFSCFDAGAIGADLDSGAAKAYAIARDDPEDFDLMVAIYPDGRGYLWRQLNQRFAD